MNARPESSDRIAAGRQRVTELYQQQEHGALEPIAPHYLVDWPHPFSCGTWRLPILPLCGDGSFLYRLGDIRWRHEGDRFLLSSEIEAIYPDLLELVRKEATRQGHALFDAAVPHLRRWTRETEGGRDVVYLDTAQTSFYEWFTLSRFLDVPRLTLDTIGKPATLRARLVPDPFDLSRYLTPVVMGVNLYLITDGGASVVIGQRSQRVGPYRGAFAAPVGGFVELSRDYTAVANQEGYLADAVMREAGEEVGLQELRREDVRVLGMGLTLVENVVNLLCYAVLPALTAVDLMTRHAVSRDEFSALTAIDISHPEPVVERLRSGAWSPVDAYGLFLTLCHYRQLTASDCQRLFR